MRQTHLKIDFINKAESFKNTERHGRRPDFAVGGLASEAEHLTAGPRVITLRGGRPLPFRGPGRLGLGHRQGHGQVDAAAKFGLVDSGQHSHPGVSGGAS